MLLILRGLPAVGKTAIAAALARDIGAVHLRIDSIEQALRSFQVTISGPEGYEVAYAVAEDNLRLGHTVIADSVNPVEVTRAAWRDVAVRAGRGGGDGFTPWRILPRRTFRLQPDCSGMTMGEGWGLRLPAPWRGLCKASCGDAAGLPFSRPRGEFGT